MDKRILIEPAKRRGSARLVNPRLAAALVKQGIYRVVDDTPAVQAVEAKPKRRAKAQEAEVEFTPSTSLEEAVEKPEPEPEPKKTTPKRTYRRRDLKADE